MSWQATTWALKQRVGSPAGKLVLLAICNYADQCGLAWPSQKRLANETEQSVDTVQRHLKLLEANGFIAIWHRRRLGGHWPGRTYKLNMPSEATEPQIAARSDRSPKLDQAANCGMARPQSLRPSHAAQLSGMNSHSNNQSNNQSGPSTKAHNEGKRTRRQIQTLQLAVARKLGNGNDQQGWVFFGALRPHQRAYLEDLEFQGLLDRDAIGRVCSELIDISSADSGGVS
jgi:hypothetical protein